MLSHLQSGQANNWPAHQQTNRYFNLGSKSPKQLLETILPNHFARNRAENKNISSRPASISSKASLNLSKLGSGRHQRQRINIRKQTSQRIYGCCGCQSCLSQGDLSPNLDRAISNTTGFESSPFPLKQGWLYDLGVVDANNDNIFDVFTTNHNATENLLLGSPSGSFTDVLSQWNLDQDRKFPGFGDFNYTPPFHLKGFHIYRRMDNELHLRLQQGSKPIQGEIVLPSPRTRKSNIQIMSRHQANAQLKHFPWQQGRRTRIRFKIRPNGHLVLNTRFSETNYSFKLEKPLQLQQVYVGGRQIHPKNHQFKLQLRDRHSMAWADYQGDGRLDVFMARGGLRGQILKFPSASQPKDEFFTSLGNGRFKNRAAQLGFEKQGCRARKVAWVDFNQDNRLDLYIAGLKSPNQLFQQQPNGRFTNVAAQQNLNFRDSTQFEWLDADNDGAQELLIARNGKLELYSKQAKQFRRRQSISAAGIEIRKLALADYDRDGDIDVYAASPQSSLLLINTGGRYTAISPAAAGLPTNALTANWVDYDNDGLQDLHVAPSGLYRQLSNQQFEATQLLSAAPSLLADAFASPSTNHAYHTWADLDNNGTRDGLFQLTQNGYGQATLYRNQLTDNHWLQLKLVGPKGNRQAIGAKVTVITANHKQLQAVGQAEGSHYSQGHYRLYFGLGQQLAAAALQITWPDGKRQEIQSPAVDQLLTVHYAPNR